jgi:hypothetical protein
MTPTAASTMEDLITGFIIPPTLGLNGVISARAPSRMGESTGSEVARGRKRSELCVFSISHSAES